MNGQTRREAGTQSHGSLGDSRVADAMDEHADPNISIAEPVSVFLIDADDAARLGLATLLARDQRFNVVGEAASGGVARVRSLQPNLIVVDPQRGTNLDLELIAELNSATDAFVCVYTLGFEPSTITDLVVAGSADGYLLKGRGSAERLCDGLYTVGRYGGLIIDRAIMLDARLRLVGRISVVPPDAAPALTEREHAILRHLSTADTLEQIAQAESISLRTVKRTIKGLETKLEAESAFVLGLKAGKLGLL